MTPFERIQFEPRAHRYTLDGQELVSVSSVIARAKPPFDAPSAAARVAAREGRTSAEVLAEWERKRVRSCTLGTAVHEHIAAALGYAAVPAPSGTPQTDAFRRWWQMAQRNLQPVHVEWVVGDAALGIAGTVDLVAYSRKTEQYHLLDWKTNGEFKTESPWGTLLAPFADLPDCYLSHYSLQLSLYRLIIERAGVLDQPLGAGYIVHLSAAGDATPYRAHDLRARLEEWLDAN